jgi:A/G-specific adenine glycosylase
MAKESLLQWYKKNARDLPWRRTNDPYKIWVSEIFLQQTQVSRVIDFYQKFLQKFPTLTALSKSSWEEFLPYFQGLGFYSRGRNMLKTAQIIQEKFSGKFPQNKKDLLSLPGIGDYTASAILSFAFGKNYGAFDVNLYRVLGRFFGTENKKEIEKKSQKVFYIPPKNNIQEHNADLLNHAFMDLGSNLCTAKKVECQKCPLQKQCDFFLSEKIIMKKKRRDVACNVSTENFISPQNTKNTEKTVCMVLHQQKKYFLVFNQNTQKWTFPEFIQEAEKKDFRHFLKEKVQKKMQIEISVRPPFFEETEVKNNFLHTKKFSRCQILSGKLLENKNQKFFTKEELSEIFLENIYSDAFIQKILGMKV